MIIRFPDEMVQISLPDQQLLDSLFHQAIETWQRIKLTSDLEKTKVKAEIEQLRSALLSSVSHDLKSPLSAMMGAAETLLIPGIMLSNDDKNELLQTILQESRRLESYIQNLLDMTRLGQGALKIERDWIAVEDIIGSAINRLKRYYPTVEIIAQLNNKVTVIFVHAALIEQALFNILENAARFNPSSTPILLSTSDSSEKLEIFVDDTGPGIPEADRENIFDMFYVISDGDKKQQSTGMGLAICRSMIRAHGGNVYVADTRKARGSRLVIELPISH